MKTTEPTLHPAAIKGIADAYMAGEDLNPDPLLVRAWKNNIQRNYEELPCFVWFVGTDPYPTFLDMQEDYSRTGILKVYDGDCDNHPFLTPEENAKARAVHDWVHLQHGYDFSARGELGVWLKQSQECPPLKEIYFSEIVGQACCFLEWGVFPNPQRLVKMPDYITDIINRYVY
jgi:hypothetical protein